MGEYLNLNTSTMNNPNENYAREIMQLFSLGTDRSTSTGRPRGSRDGTIIPTYDQFTVTEFARALTGWHFAAQHRARNHELPDPMIASTANHDLGTKQLLNGFTTTAGASPQQDLNDAIDNIFNHPNVGPYIAKHLIRQLVTSNPSPDYVARVATVFNNNGSGVRGDMKAVIMAILLDPEARQTPPADPNFGRLKDPVTFCTASPARDERDGGERNRTIRRLPAADRVPHGSRRASAADRLQLLPSRLSVCPERRSSRPSSAIFDTMTALKRANFVNTMVFSNIPMSANAPNGTARSICPS